MIKSTTEANIAIAIAGIGCAAVGAIAGSIIVSVDWIAAWAAEKINKKKEMKRFAALEEKPSKNFDDVAGLDNAKTVLTGAVIMPINAPHLANENEKQTKHILLYGPPGNGKTYIAMALAGELNNTTIFAPSMKELLSKSAAESAKIVVNLFKAARERKPSIIFIDEFDSIARKRGGESESDCERIVKSTFLTQLEGFNTKENDGVTFIAATNLPWDIDEAMIRRFDRRIYIPLPDDDARSALLRMNTAKMGISLKNEEIQTLSYITERCSCSDICKLIKDAVTKSRTDLLQAKAFKRGRAIGPNGRAMDNMWIPCDPQDVGAVCMRYKDLNPNEVGRPEVKYKHLFDVIPNCKQTVSTDTLKKFEGWTKSLGEDGSL